MECIYTLLSEKGSRGNSKEDKGKPPSNIQQDHAYCNNITDAKIEHDHQSILMTKLQSLFRDSISSKNSTAPIFRELRAQSSSLTSRTTSFCSVLYKYREISRMEKNADHFLDEIIVEMMER